jgi:unsaturated rhamnogalacturonyl hydrolase
VTVRIEKANCNHQRIWSRFARLRIHAVLVRTFLAVCLICVLVSAMSEPKEFKNWPAGETPQEIGKKVAERFVSGPHTNFARPSPPTQITYPETITWYGALTFAQLSKDRELSRRLIERFDRLTSSEANLIPTPLHVDSTVFGSVPLEIYIETKDPRYLDLGLRFANAQWDETTADGLTSQTRFWIDDMYMITLVQVQAYRATGDTKYTNRAALEMSAYLKKLQQPNGLFFHAPNAPFFWGRGNGWVAAGMTELLRSLSSDAPLRPQILESYRRMMSELLILQSPDGLWRQLLDHPDSWPETSSTAMFTFALITGVKEGWLDGRKYRMAARKAWLGLVGNLNSDGDLRNVCEGTNISGDVNYYLGRARNTGDLHGQGPLLWCASALLR